MFNKNHNIQWAVNTVHIKTQTFIIEGFQNVSTFPNLFIIISWRYFCFYFLNIFLQTWF